MFKKTDILFYKEACSLSFVIAAGLALIIIAIKLVSYSEIIFASPNIFVSLSLVFLYLFPPILNTILPISFFTGSALVSLRMSLDREIDALFSSGMSVRQMLFPPIILGVITALLMLGNSLYYEPYSKEQFRLFKWFQARQIMESFLINNLKAKSFVTDFPLIDNNRFIFYADDVSKKQIMSNIFMAFENIDMKTNTVFVAETGTFLKTTTNGYPDFIFKLTHGAITSGNKTFTEFSQMDISMLSAFGDKLKASDEYTAKTTTSSLPNRIKPFSAALCALFFPALGMCLGLINPNFKPFFVYIGIGFVTVLFYSLMSICRIVIGDYNMSPFLIYSFPPLIFCSLMIWLARERHKIK